MSETPKIGQNEVTDAEELHEHDGADELVEVGKVSETTKGGIFGVQPDNGNGVRF